MHVSLSLGTPVYRSPHPLQDALPVLCDIFHERLILGSLATRRRE